VRISARCSDSSNRSAKDSDIQFPCACPGFQPPMQYRERLLL
jgi:hypothetical protein